MSHNEYHNLWNYYHGVRILVHNPLSLTASMVAACMA